MKENVIFYLGHAVRIVKSEGQQGVYKALNQYAIEPVENLPMVFDVLNCPEGCNLGTGCDLNSTVFEINGAMDRQRLLASDLYQKTAADEITEIERHSSQTLRSINDISDEILGYKQMAKMVNSLALKTNLLSLSASIEAARAGKAGNGFSVVTQAIRRLSLESQDSVRKVVDTSRNATYSISAITESGQAVEQLLMYVYEFLKNISTSSPTTENFTASDNPLPMRFPGH